MTDIQYPPFYLAHDTARRNASAACLTAPDGYVVRIKAPNRSTMQNRRLWALLTDISSQVSWYGKKLTSEDWKMVFTASLKRLDVVPNLDGSGFVALGLSTSKMSKKEMNDLMLLIESFGAEHGVKW